MFEKTKKNLPTGIMTVGFVIFLILLMLSRFDGQGYESVILNEFIRETALVVLTECVASAIAFKILIRKEKS